LVYYFYFYVPLIVALDGRNVGMMERPPPELPEVEAPHGYGCYIIVIGVLLFDHLYHTSFTHPALLTIAICLSSIPLLYTLYIIVDTTNQHSLTFDTR